jgi:two-component system sensor histidine kinase CreC
MKIGLRILLGYFLVVGLAGWFLLAVFMQEVKPGVRATQEDALVDTAYLLAALVADDVKTGKIDDSALMARIRGVREKPLNVRVAGLNKPDFRYRIYITDARGIVIFDSTGKAVGEDYSRWNDVYLTLRGKYGARSTRAIYGDDSSTVMHVAAPVRDGARIIGVLTVAKPNSVVQPFVERSQRVILTQGVVLLVLSLLIGAAFAWWLSHSLRQLLHYISEVEAGRKASLPALGKNEIGTLGRALEAMRHKLEGKEYVEELMHTMAHELKSPIAAIQGAAELLQEDMAPEQRRHFLANILSQNARQKQLIDKLLALVKVEKQQVLDAPSRIRLRELVAQVEADCSSRLAARGLRIETDIADVELAGDALLLRQALGNLVDNSIDFSPDGAVIAVQAAVRDGKLALHVRDHGTGIPAFAQDRLFERFYSLPRPGGAKSTGLGLAFVREAAALHGGTVSVANGEGGGAVALLVLPVQ